VDINTILTIFGAPTDCKDLILALATGMRDLREQNRALARELESERAAMLPVHNLLLEDKESMRVERDAALARLATLEAAIKRQVNGAPELGSSLDDLLRYAAAAQTEVRVTLAGKCSAHEGTREGVPEWDSYGSEDNRPWFIQEWYCGTAADPLNERIIGVELL
jgi:hypothetical protein